MYACVLDVLKVNDIIIKLLDSYEQYEYTKCNKSEVIFIILAQVTMGL